MTGLFFDQMKKRVEGTGVTLEKFGEYHYQLRGVFIVNIWPSKTKYYVEGTNKSGRYNSLDDLVSLSIGEKNPPEAEIKVKRINLKKQKALLWEQSHVCFSCGKEIETFDQATVEHKIPLSRGGSNRLSNLALSHGNCNQVRGNDISVEMSPNERILLNRVQKAETTLKQALDALNTCTKFLIENECDWKDEYKIAVNFRTVFKLDKRKTK